MARASLTVAVMGDAAARASVFVSCAVALCACGGAEPSASTSRTTPLASPTAALGAPQCPLEASLPLDRQAVVVLGEGPDTDAAARRWMVDTYGILELDGYDSIEALVPPENVDGSALAQSLHRQLEDSGVLELADGCYGADIDDRRGGERSVTTLVIPARGRVHQYALVGDTGPIELVRAVRLVRSYARAIALPYDEEAQRALALGPEASPAAPDAR